MFDFDGTLVDSNSIKHQAFYDVTSHIPGADTLLDQILPQNNFGDRYTILSHLAEQLVDIASHTRVANELAFAYTEACERLITKSREIPGAENALLHFAQQNLTLAISSATPAVNLLPIVVSRGLQGYFDEILGAPQSKAEHVNYVMKKYQLKSAETVYIGDSQADLEASQQTGCHFIGIGKTAERFESFPPVLIPDLVSLPEQIYRLNG